jgi:hypothetical protein
MQPCAELTASCCRSPSTAAALQLKYLPAGDAGATGTLIRLLLPLPLGFCAAAPARDRDCCAAPDLCSVPCSRDELISLLALP